MSQTLGNPLKSTTPTVVSQTGARTTGSPLLDSFLPTPKSKNTAYLSGNLPSQRAGNPIGWQSTQPTTRPATLPTEPNVVDKPNFVDKTVSDKTVSKSSVIQAAVAKKPVVDKPTIEKPVTEKPVVEEPITEKPVVEELTTKQVATEGTAIEKPTTKADVTKLADAAAARQVLAAKRQLDQTVPSKADSSRPFAQIESQVKVQNQPKRQDKAENLNQPSATRRKQPRRRGLNPSLEKAAAVGMLDLNDKLLFGGEDDELISTYLGGEDPLTTEEDETVVLKYLSKQIAESTLTKIKSRLPLAPQPAAETERSKIVLDAENFKVAQRAIALAEQEAASQTPNAESEKDKSDIDIAAINRQITQLNQKVANLTKELSDLTTSAPEHGKQHSQSGAGEAA